jgi:hypothetical protein
MDKTHPINSLCQKKSKRPPERFKNLKEGLIQGKPKKPLSSECPPLKKFMKLKCHPTPYGNGYYPWPNRCDIQSQQ